MSQIDQIKQKIATFLEFNKEIPQELLNEYNRYRIFKYKVKHKSELQPFDVGIIKQYEATINTDDLFNGILQNPKQNESSFGIVNHEVMIGCRNELDQKKESEPIQKEVCPIELIRQGKMAIENDKDAYTLQTCLSFWNNGHNRMTDSWRKYYHYNTKNEKFYYQDETNLPKIKASKLIKIIQNKDKPDIIKAIISELKETIASIKQPDYADIGFRRFLDGRKLGLENAIKIIESKEKS